MRLPDAGDVGRRPMLAADERGTTAIEYALLASIAAVTAITGLQAFGTEMGALYGVLEGISRAITAVLGR